MRPQLDRRNKGPLPGKVDPPDDVSGACACVLDLGRVLVVVCFFVCGFVLHVGFKSEAVMSGILVVMFGVQHNCSINGFVGIISRVALFREAGASPPSVRHRNR